MEPSPTERNASAVLDGVLSREPFGLYVSDHVLEGVARVLETKHAWPPERSRRLCARLIHEARLSGGSYVPHPPARTILQLSEDDRRVHDLALAAGAEFLVSRDADFDRAAGSGSGVRALPSGVVWCTPGTFTRIIRQYGAEPGEKRSS
jgi:hypothetical protein